MFLSILLFSCFREWSLMFYLDAVVTSLRKAAFHLDISPLVDLPCFVILEYRTVWDLNFSARYLFLNIRIKTFNWNWTYGTIHSKFTFLEVNKRCIYFLWWKSYSLCATLNFYVIYECVFVETLPQFSCSGLLHVQLDTTFLCFQLDI